MSDQEIKLEQFEGPLSLLLQLIEQEELDITEVSLAKVTDQYITILEAQTDLHPDEIADFLVVAAKLLYIKSQVLAPEYFQEEETGETDLERQLRMYKEYIAASKHVQVRWREDSYFFSRFKPFRLPRPKFIPPKGIDTTGLYELMQGVLRELEPIARLRVKKMNTTVSIKDRIRRIKELIKDRLSFEWHELTTVESSKTEKIVNFLAVLELVKQREVEVIQEAIFTNFTIRKTS